VIELPTGNDHQLPGGELPGANLQPSPLPPGGSNRTSPITTAEPAVVPDDDSNIDCEPPDGADDQDVVLHMPGSWPCGAGLDSEYDPDGRGLNSSASPRAFGTVQFELSFLMTQFGWMGPAAGLPWPGLAGGRPRATASTGGKN